MKFRKDIDALSGPSNFIRLKDGESVLGICRGDLHETFVLWNDRVKSEVAEGTPGAKFNFSVNFVVKEGSSYVAKVLEGGAQIYKQLAAIAEEYDLEKTVIKISREGTGLETEYSVLPAGPKQQVTKEALSFIETIALNELGEKPAGKPPVKNHAPGAGGEGLPF